MNDSSEELSGVDILIEGDKITSVSKGLDAEHAERVIDATGMVVLPGFINTHHHFYQTLTRNIPTVQDTPLFHWLLESYEVWRQLTLEGVELSTRTAILEMMKSGVSTSSDHLYLFPEQSEKELIDAEIQVAQQIGFRFHATRGSMSLGRSLGGLPPDDVVQSEAEIEQVILGAEGNWNEFDKALMTAVDELHSSSSITDVTWRRLSSHYSEHQMMDFVFTVGQYTLVSMALNSFGVEIDEGYSGFPESSKDEPGLTANEVVFLP